MLSTDGDEQVKAHRARLEFAKFIAFLLAIAPAKRRALNFVRRGAPRTVRNLATSAWSNWPITVSAIAAGSIVGYALSLPDILTGVHGYHGHGYDDGVYFGAAINLIHGRLPYRDYVIVQPPGIAILMAPIAAIGQLIGERDGFVLARCITALVTAANAGLIASLLRHRGRTVMAIGGLAFAFFPLTVAADHTLMLEPYLLVFCLLGIRIGFSHAQLASQKRLFVAALMFGIAGTIKTWAIFPFVAFLIFVVVRSRRSIRYVLLGAVAGFVVPLIVFFAAAPGSLIHDVFVAQDGRIALSSFSHIGTSLLDVTGLSGFGSLTPSPAIAVLVAVIVAVLVFTIFFFTRKAQSDLDRFVLVSAVVVTVGMLSSTQFVAHYSYFTAGFDALVLATALGLLVSRLVRGLDVGSELTWRSLAPVPLGLALIVIVALTVIVVHTDVGYAQSYLSQAEDNGATVAAVIPAGSCVVSDQVSFLIDANRLFPADTNCPTLLDWYGTWLSDDAADLPPTAGPYPFSLANEWTTLLTRADYLVLFSPNSDAYPRTVSTDALFSQYRLVYSTPGTYVYCHVKSPNATPSSAAAAIDAGLTAQKGSDLQTAMNDYNRALVDDSCNAAALYDLGTVDQANGNSAAAIALYQEVLAISPGYPPAQSNLSYLQGIANS